MVCIIICPKLSSILLPFPKEIRFYGFPWLLTSQSWILPSLTPVPVCLSSSNFIHIKLPLVAVSSFTVDSQFTTDCVEQSNNRQCRLLTSSLEKEVEKIKHTLNPWTCADSSTNTNLPPPLFFVLTFHVSCVTCHLSPTYSILP